MHFVLDFFRLLPGNIQYAIERGLDDISISSEGDLDVLIRKKDFPALIQAARNANILISLSISYSGARIFLGDNDNIKRVDFNWILHCRGIPLGPVEDYIKARQIDPTTELFVLPEKQHASVIYFIKNTYGGAENYRQLLEKHNLQILTKKQSDSVILTALIRHPLASITGKLRYLACYFLRITCPTGLLVCYTSRLQLENNKDIMYLFQNRISNNKGLKAFLDTSFLSKLCVTSNPQHADITLNFDDDIDTITTSIIQYLRHSRTCIPSLLFKLA